MILRKRLTPEFQRSVSSALAALDRGAERAAETARRWSREEMKPAPEGEHHTFIFAVLAVMGGAAIISALALIAFAPR